MVTADTPDESHGHPEHTRAPIVPVAGNGVGPVPALPGSAPAGRDLRGRSGGAGVLYLRGVTGPEAPGEPVLAG
jgi:hypothetical protein